MNRPTVLIVSDEREFPSAIATSWVGEGDTPAFVVRSDVEFVGTNFDLVVVGGLNKSPDTVLATLSRSGKPAIHISRANGSMPPRTGVLSLPEISGWPEVVVAVGKRLLRLAHAESEVARLSELISQLERQAGLGRYMIEMRHNLNNALTSILGNCDLILLEEYQLPAAAKGQLETIRNMGLRLNEIMQRFTSLQKEMQLVEQQKAAAKSASA